MNYACCSRCSSETGRSSTGLASDADLGGIDENGSVSESCLNDPWTSNVECAHWNQMTMSRNVCLWNGDVTNEESEDVQTDCRWNDL